MEGDAAGGFVRLAVLPDAAAAHLCAALLRSAGIEARLRGEALGPYRLTVGDMAVTEVWVPAADLDDARDLIEETAAAEPGPPVTPGGTAGRARGRRWWPVVAFAVLGLLAWRLAERLF